MSLADAPPITRNLNDLLSRVDHPEFPATYTKGGMTVQRRFVPEGISPYVLFDYRTEHVRITDPDGTVAFEVDNFEVPVAFDALAAKIAASKYARKTMVPRFDHATGDALLDDDGNQQMGGETSFKMIVSRIANSFMWWGMKGGYFASEADAVAMRDEYAYMLLNQMAANNSPVWFNVGLHEQYGIVEDSDGNTYWDPETGTVKESAHKYERSSVNACFIMGVEDNLVSDGGIFETMIREARLFKGGSGAGGNWSRIRGKGEPLTGGGSSSGVMSFLKVVDAAAGSIKSGGTTRRAAKMVILDADHPEINDFIWCKANEEKKIPLLEAGGYSTAWNAENGAYANVFFQNANHSVRIPRGFMERLGTNQPWDLKARKALGEDGKPLVMATTTAEQIWSDIALAAHQSADPGIQFDALLNDWNTAPNDAELRGTNPCSEYTHIDNTACNLASLNLVKFFQQEELTFEVDSFEHASRLLTIVLELAVHMSHYPADIVAKNSFEHRTLGLGYANVGGLLMRAGLPYDSDEGRAAMAAITALMHNTAVETSAELAAAVGPCIAYGRNKDAVKRVLHNHRRATYGSAAKGAQVGEYDGLTVNPQGINHDLLRTTVFANIGPAAIKSADRAFNKAMKRGVRNMQWTVLAPTGTIGLLMGVDTTGVEPTFSLLAYKTLAGGGAVTIVTNAVPDAMRALGYDETAVSAVATHIAGTRTLNTPGAKVNRESLAEKGLTGDLLDTIEAGLAASMDVAGAMGAYLLSDEQRAQFGVPEDEKGSFLPYLGFDALDVETSDNLICGFQCVEGAPLLDPGHYPVFDTANPGRGGERYIAASGHVKALGATAGFLSGCASKTVNLPKTATVEDVESAHRLAYEQGVKCVAVYVDESKKSQPLSSKKRDDASLEADERPQITVVGADPNAHALKELLSAIGEVPQGMSPTGFYGDRTPRKFRLPTVRSSVTEKICIGGVDVFLTHGAYPDGSLGDIFLKMSKEGRTIDGLLSVFATAVSMGLQRGVPLSEFVEKFRSHSFEPAGVVEGHPNLKMASSIVDAVFRILSHRYLGDDASVQVSTNPLTAAPAPLAAPVEARLPWFLLRRTTRSCRRTSRAGWASCAPRAGRTHCSPTVPAKFAGSALRRQVAVSAAC
jgi:ribonucleoside-diphosphate reductase alpha chain